MNTLKKEIIIYTSPQKVFSHMDDLSKTGMHMKENSMMMMGSKLSFERLEGPLQGIGTTYRWHGKIMGLPVDITETVTKWTENQEKVWETTGDPKIILLGWYRMILKLMPVKEGTLVSLQIDYTQPNGVFYNFLYFFLSRWYCHWCLNNMLNDSKKTIENFSAKS
jgi:hypothetical protein